MIVLIDTNIWIYLYVAGLTWVIRGIVQSLGHEVWITDAVRRELDDPKHGGATARTDGMFADGTVVIAKVHVHDQGMSDDYKKAEDEIIALINQSPAKGSRRFITNDTQALKKCLRYGIKTFDLKDFLVWIHRKGLAEHGDVVSGFDRVVEDGTVFEVTRKQFIDELAKSG
ncbi:hypothetical protein IBTHAUMO2_460003 [Nitrosopumilaceae archaeon]|nr:hypothetical protein IBTHAUMO2_460003 [Nitrosopumilaceae archaeon]